VDATAATDYGSVLLYNNYGWHEVDRSWWAGARIQMAAFDSYSSPNRLYYGVGTHVVYTEFSDKGDNPGTALPSAFDAFGWLETGWITGGMLEIWKSLSTIRVLADSINNGSATAGYFIDYQTDDSGIWHNIDPSVLNAVGEDTEIEWKPTRGTDISTFETATTPDVIVDSMTLDEVTNISTDDYISIGNESRQVTAVGTSIVNFTPVTRHNKGLNPVLNGWPAFKKIKLRIRFASLVHNGGSMVIKALRASYANQLQGWLRWQFNIRASEEMTLLDDSVDTRTAKDMHDWLIALVQETNQVVKFTDIYENTYNAQVVALEAKPQYHTIDNEETTICWRVAMQLVEI